MSIIGLDPQANGWRDDGTESGVIRTEQVRGDLVPVPFKNGWYQADATGSSASLQSSVFTNPDGTGTGLNISVNAGSNGVRVWQHFQGTTFGIRYRATPTSAPVTVSVDGVPVLVDTSAVPSLLSTEGVSINQNYGAAITHRNLDDGDHVAEIAVAAKDTGSNVVLLYGYLAERSAGYTNPDRAHLLLNEEPVPTSSAYIGRGSTGQQLAAVTRIFYHNPTAAPVTVRVSYLGGMPLWKAELAPDSVAVCDFGQPLGNGTLLHHVASAAGVISQTMGVM